eukprot:gene4058-4717_t
MAWNDANANGAQETAESADGSVMVSLLKVTVVDSAITPTTDGAYNFKGVAPGDHYLKMAADPFTKNTPLRVSLSKESLDSNAQHQPSIKGQPMQAAAPRASAAPMLGAQPKQSIGPQASMLMSSTNQRSTISGGQASSRMKPSTGAGGSTVRTDPRVVTDKQFQSTSISRILNFLTSANFNSAISRKTLTSPSIKEFYAITEFLIQHIDGTFKFGAKPDEELVAFFKNLRYPINPTVLKRYLGVSILPQYWPHLLAALVWLVELIEYDYQASIIKDQDILDEDEFINVLNSVVIKSYISFLADDEEGGNGADNYLDELFGTKEGHIRAHMEEMLEDQVNYHNEIAELEAEPDNMPALNEELQALQEDVAKFETLVRDMTDYNQQVRRTIVSHQKEHDGLAAELEDLEQRKASLEEIVAEQQNRSVDAKIINQRRIQLQEELTKAANERKRMERAKSDKTNEITSMITAIGELIHQYKDTVQKFVPVTNHSTYQVELTVTEIDAKITDLKMIKKSLIEFAEVQHDKVKEAEETIIVNETEDKQLEDKIGDLKDQINRSEKKYKDQEDSIKNEKEKLGRDLASIQKKVDMRAKDNKNVKENMRQDLEEVQMRMVQTQHDCDLQLAEMERKTKDIKVQVMRLLEQAIEHHDSIHKSVSKVFDDVKRTSDEQKSFWAERLVNTIFAMIDQVDRISTRSTDTRTIQSVDEGLILSPIDYYGTRDNLLINQDIQVKGIKLALGSECMKRYQYRCEGWGMKQSKPAET